MVERNRRTQAGVTLIDILIAIALLSVGGGGLLAMQVISIAAGAQARHLTQATALAQQEMEQLSYSATPLTSGADSLDEHGCSSTRSCAQQGVIYGRSWTVGAGVPLPLTVTVSYADGAGKQHRVVLHGLR